jgi:hypothetical protein
MDLKKTLILTTALALTLSATNVFAAPGGKPGKNEKNGQAQSEQETKVKVENETEEETVTSSVYEEEGKGNGGKGLLNAYGKVKNPVAAANLAEKLKTKYNIDVTIEVDAELEAVAEQLEAEGEIEAAIEVQQESLQANLNDISKYKKLGKMKEKMGDKGVKAYVNGKTPKFDAPPVVKYGRTLVPFRAISESLNAEVTWNSEEKSVTVTRDGIVVKIMLGSNIAYVNGEEVALDVPGEIMSNRVFVPMRFLSEAFKAQVSWDQETSSVIIVDETQIEENTDAEGTTDEAETSESTDTSTDPQS